jgi:hypothetical protein
MTAGMPVPLKTCSPPAGEGTGDMGDFASASRVADHGQHIKTHRPILEMMASNDAHRCLIQQPLFPRIDTLRRYRLRRIIPSRLSDGFHFANDDGPSIRCQGEDIDFRFAALHVACQDATALLP